MQQQTKPYPSHKQQEILYYYYRFRFLHTRHIQQFLHHKNPTRIQTWLKLLKDDLYIYSFYDQTTVEGRATNAVYCLTAKANSVLKQNKECNERILARLYREKKLSKRLRNHCLFLADIYFLLTEFYKDQNIRMHFSTKVDLVVYSYFPQPLPDAYIALIQRGVKRKRYFLEIIDPQTPWFVINARVQQYLSYSEDKRWYSLTKEQQPVLLFVCWEKRSIRYLKKALKTAFDASLLIDFSCYFTTRDKLLQHGFSNDIWQKVKLDDV